MKRRHITALVVLGALPAVLAGCAAQGVQEVVDTSLTLEDAKATAMRMKRELAAMVPADVVASVDQRQTGVLMSCSVERAYQWTGQMQIAYLAPKALDPETLVDRIESTFADRAGFTAMSAPFRTASPASMSSANTARATS